MNLRGRRIHFWCPGLRQQGGGIEAYTLALTQAAVAWDGDAQITVCAKNEKHEAAAGSAAGHFRRVTTGDVPPRFRTAAFSTHIVVQALLEKPDLIVITHLNFSPVARLLKRLLSIPYWVSLHGIEAWNLVHSGRRRAIAGADLLLPVSEFTRDRVRMEQGIPAERFFVLHDTVDEEKFTIGNRPEWLAQRYGLSVENAIILTVGRLAAAEAYKGQDRIIRALPVIRQRVPGVRYLIVGDGDDRPRLEALAASLGVTEAVVFAGRIPEAEIVEHFRLCDLFAMPSTGEGFGITYLEAMACGKPTLGGTKDAAVDALCGGELGALVDPHSERELADTISAILQKTFPHPLMFHPELLRRKAIEHFGLQVFNRAVASRFGEFFGRGSTARVPAEV